MPGLVYYNYRYYNPAQGKWLSRDPIAERGGLNFYGFVGNSGLNQWDRLGLEFIWHWLSKDWYAGTNTGKAFVSTKDTKPEGKKHVVRKNWGRQCKTNKKNNKTCCWFKKKPVYDVHYWMHKLRYEKVGTRRYRIGYDSSGFGMPTSYEASTDVVRKMFEHEKGHIADFKEAYKHTIQKLLDDAAKYVGEENAFTIEGTNVTDCRTAMSEKIQYAERVSEWEKLWKFVNKARDGVQRIAMSGDAPDITMKVSPHLVNGWEDFKYSYGDSLKKPIIHGNSGKTTGYIHYEK